MVLIEQAADSSYTSVFITHPHSFVDLDKNIKACSAFLKFLDNRILFSKPEWKEWYDKQFERIFKE
jgi:hypothetical protein